MTMTITVININIIIVIVVITDIIFRVVITNSNRTIIITII